MSACYPQTIFLPDGTQARVRITHVVETNDKGEQTLTQVVSAPPVYELRDGTTVAIEVAIPPDLTAHWFWFGSALVSDDGLQIISTATYAPPGWPSTRETCFDVARQLEAGMQRRAAMPGRPMQLAMELV